MHQEGDHLYTPVSTQEGTNGHNTSLKHEAGSSSPSATHPFAGVEGLLTQKVDKSLSQWSCAPAVPSATNRASLDRCQVVLLWGGWGNSCFQGAHRKRRGS